MGQLLGLGVRAGGQDFFRANLGSLDVIRPEVSRVSRIEGPRTPEATVKEQDWELPARVDGVRPRVRGREKGRPRLGV